MIGEAAATKKMSYRTCMLSLFAWVLEKNCSIMRLVKTLFSFIVAVIAFFSLNLPPIFPLMLMGFLLLSLGPPIPILHALPSVMLRRLFPFGLPLR